MAGNARDLLAEPNEAQEPHGPSSEAGEFLRERTALGMTPAKTIRAEAKEAGISWITVRRAFKKIGGRTHKGGMTDGWYWSLPGTEGTQKIVEETEAAHPKNVSIFGMK